MFLKIFIVSIFIVTFSSLTKINAQIPIDQELKDALRYEGYRNVHVVANYPLLLVAIENDIYRFEPDAIDHVLSYMFSYSRHFTNMVLIIQKQKIPIITIEITSADIADYLNKKLSRNDFLDKIKISYDVSKYASRIRDSKTFNKNNFATDLEIAPAIGLQLGNYDTPFRFKLGLKPVFKTSFYKGQLFTAGFYIPLVDHKYIDKFNYFRLGLLDYSQVFRLYNGLFIKFSTGLFTQQRYGFNTEIIKYLFNGRLSLKADMAYTGYLAYLQKDVEGINFTTYSKPTVEIGEIKYFQYFGEIACRIPKYDLLLNIGYGKYLYHNFAWKVDILRNFNEYIFGFVAYKSKTGYNYGFKVSVPLIPEKYKINKGFKIHSSKYLNYEYLAASDYARTFSTASGLRNDLWELNPQFIKRYLLNGLSR